MRRDSSGLPAGPGRCSAILLDAVGRLGCYRPAWRCRLELRFEWPAWGCCLLLRLRLLGGRLRLRPAGTPASVTKPSPLRSSRSNRGFGPVNSSRETLPSPSLSIDLNRSTAFFLACSENVRRSSRTDPVLLGLELAVVVVVAALEQALRRPDGPMPALRRARSRYRGSCRGRRKSSRNGSACFFATWARANPTRQVPRINAATQRLKRYMCQASTIRPARK